ncbi:MAG: sugar ABC transporter permease [Anaerolineaceae bacterium]|nr:sugar ABC transporter permease [Anaerolineaceae bacterium]
MERLLNAIVAIVFGVGLMLLYFYGSNWLLDRLLPDRGIVNGVFQSREKQRERIRPWLFVGPSLLILGIYLVYPAVQTLFLSFFDSDGEDFVGLANYGRALGDSRFVESIRNNILWLIVVPGFSVVFGLVIAVLADRVSWGNIAKSLIFMPMAISFVGASAIWKLVYTINPDIGLLNAIYTGSGNEAVDVLQIPFWNSFFLMVILVWIQTGFAMVLLSAALRGVPEETLEAARIDGANEVQTFFRIMVPQIMGTIFVVWTTIVITVLKVFDIVLAMTNGNWNTQVMANLMFDQMFRAFDTGYASFLALVIMVAVIPIMVVNIRRMNREEAMR